MTAAPPPPPSLFRSLGADDSYFDTKARAASKEAEQRWPLFKAVAPARAEETPVLSPQQKGTAWNTPAPSADSPQRPRLSRPGLGQKLATGLRELGQKTRQESAAPPPVEPPPAQDSPAAPRPRPPRPPLPDAAAPLAPDTRSAALAGSAWPRPPAPSAPPPLPPLAQSMARPASVATSAAAGGSAPAAKKGLFAPPAPAASPTPAPAASASPDPSLSGLFARLSGRATPGGTAPRRGLLFGRTGQ